jgi:hypothetical protein
MTGGHDQHSGGDQLLTSMGGWPGVADASFDSGSLSVDVVAPVGDLAKLSDRLGEVAFLRGVAHSGAVEGAVEQLIVLPAQTTWEALSVAQRDNPPREACLLSRQSGGQDPRTGRRPTIQPKFAQQKVQVHTVRWSSLAELSKSDECRI